MTGDVIASAPRRTRIVDTALGCVLSMVVATIVFVQPLWFDQVHPQWDFLTHVRWTGEFLAALHDGWLVPRWAFASHGGLGDPTFLYYQPLLYYATSAFAFLGLPPERALLWAGWLSLVLAGTVAMALLSRTVDRRAGLFGLGLVVTSPALLVVSTQLSAYPWIFASPFCILFAHECLRPIPSPGRLGSWLALICLAHVLTGLMILVMVAIARPLIFPPSRRTWRGHVATGAGVIIGLALAGFYLVPAMTLQNLISPGEWLNGFYVDWHRGFAFPSFTFARYGWRLFSMQLPIPLLTAAMITLVIWVTRKPAVAEPGLSQAHVAARRFAIVALVGLLLSTELSYPAFAVLSPLQKLQHAFRFMVPTHLCACMALAMVTSARRPGDQEMRWIDRSIAAVLVLGLLLTVQFEYSLAKAGKPVPTYASLVGGESGQAEYLPATTGPDWKAYNASGGFLGECARLRVACDVPTRQTASFAVWIESDHPSRIRLPLFAFPAWRMTIDGVDQDSTIDRSTGLLEATLTPGRHAVAVRWTTLPAEIHGRWLSLAALLLILVLAVRSSGRTRRDRLAGTMSSA